MHGFVCFEKRDLISLGSRQWHINVAIAVDYSEIDLFAMCAHTLEPERARPTPIEMYSYHMSRKKWV